MRTDSSIPVFEKVLKEIEAILKREDVAAMISIHTPGHSQSAVFLETSYSCAFIGERDGKTGLHISMLKGDFGGDRSRKIEVIKDTSNMLHLLSTAAGHSAMATMKASDYFDGYFDIENDDSDMEMS